MEDPPVLPAAAVHVLKKGCICGMCEDRRKANAIKAVKDAADAAQSALDKKFKSGMASALTVDEPPPPVSYIGYSMLAGGEDKLNKEVQAAYDRVPMNQRSDFHSHCAEARSLSKAIDAGADLSRAVSAAAAVGKGKRNGRATPACPSCKWVLNDLGVKDAHG